MRTRYEVSLSYWALALLAAAALGCRSERNDGVQWVRAGAFLQRHGVTWYAVPQCFRPTYGAVLLADDRQRTIGRIDIDYGRSPKVTTAEVTLDGRKVLFTVGLAMVEQWLVEAAAQAPPIAAHAEGAVTIRIRGAPRAMDYRSPVNPSLLR
jgi:hypothetical protein